jgi:hypothetical protein
MGQVLAKVGFQLLPVISGGQGWPKVRLLQGEALSSKTLIKKELL